jgi:hypothetical protein
MPTFQIVSHDKGRQIGHDLHELPNFYMEDFTRLGFRVSDCDAAVKILDRQAFSISRKNGNAAVSLGGASQVAAAVRLLAENGVNCDIADVADGMYQG